MTDGWRILGVGRPRRRRPDPLLPMRQLGYAMEQIRNAVGLRLDPLEFMNRAIIELYPEVENRRSGRAGPVSVPRLLRSPHLLDEAEQGKYERVRDQRRWLQADPEISANQVRSNPIPAWLVRAYDVAFGADGYLVDFYRWAVAADAAQTQVPPRLTTIALPAVPTDKLRDLMFEHFAGVPADIGEVIEGYVDELARLAPGTAGGGDPAWVPQAMDKSVIEDDGTRDFPEGTILRAHETKVISWTFRNIGSIAWSDRLLARVGQDLTGGLRTPPFVPIPATGAGETCVVTCPIRAPAEPGTYRACFKMAWPDGTLCYPTTLIGALASVIVPPAEMSQSWRSWTRE